MCRQIINDNAQLDYFDMYDILTVDAEAFESVQKKPKLDMYTKSDGIFNLSDTTFTPSYSLKDPKGHCKAFPKHA